MRLADRFWRYFFANPAAWFLFFLFILLLLSVYRTYELGGQLYTVCSAIQMPNDVTDTPKTVLEKAQGICASHRHGPPK